MIKSINVHYEIYSVINKNKTTDLGNKLYKS